MLLTKVFAAGLDNVTSAMCRHKQWHRADVQRMPPHRQCLNFMCHPIEHPAHLQASMTLPTRPNAIFSTLQGAQNPDTKPTLQRAKNANTPSPPTTLHGLVDNIGSKNTGHYN